MAKNCTHHTFEPKYFVDFKILKINEGNILLLIMPNGKERKTSMNDVKPCNITSVHRECLGFITWAL